MEKLLLVMLGGALGSGARWLVGLGAAARLPGHLHAATLTVNVLGSFAMGLLAQWAVSGTELSAEKRAFVASGLLGGFTTYSSFNQELLDAVQRGEIGFAAGYALLTALLCLAAGFAGLAAARALGAG